MAADRAIGLECPPPAQEGRMLLEATPSADTTDPASVTATFERAFEEAGSADPGDFLPSEANSNSLTVLGKLVRADLRMSWAAGRRRYLDDYRRLYPVASAVGATNQSHDHYGGDVTKCAS